MALSAMIVGLFAAVITGVLAVFVAGSGVFVSFLIALATGSFITTTLVLIAVMIALRDTEQDVDRRSCEELSS